MSTSANDNIDYRLLNRLSNLVICSSCLRRGKVTPVPQVISGRHSLTNRCPNAAHSNAAENTAEKPDAAVHLASS